MQPVMHPLKLGDQGQAVANLQEALLLLIDRESIRLSQEQRRSLNEALSNEQRA